METQLESDESLAELLTLVAEVTEFGTIRYRNTNGVFHRVHGPAVNFGNGSTVWYFNGYLHRNGGPAVESSDGSRYWYQHGKRHREDGPAMIETYGDGELVHWYLDGELLSRAEFDRRVNKI